MYDVIGVGAASIDFVYQLPATPQPDTVDAKLRISRHFVSPGGQTATVLCTCAALGMKTTFIGTVGDDAHAATLVTALRERGVDVSGVIIRPGTTPYAVILVDERHGERIVLWDRPVAAALRADDLSGRDFSAARIVHVDDVDGDAALAAAAAAHAAGVRVTSDIEQAGAPARALIDAVDVAIFAEHVPAALSPGTSIEDALRALQSRADQMTCVTLGARGAMLCAGGEMYSVPGHAIRAVDTTGAGDVFRGAFITALLRGDSPSEILAFANAAAAVSCTKLGAITGVPTLEETERLLASKA
jgi:sugar/nucleoside kinase (ribokinase family)